MKPLYFETEAKREDGYTFHSDQCFHVITAEVRSFLHAILDEWLDAYPRNPDIAKLRFEACGIHPTHKDENA